MDKEPWVYNVYVGKPTADPLVAEAEQGLSGYIIVPIETKFPNLYTSVGNTWGGSAFNKPYYPCTVLANAIEQVEKPEGEHLIHHNYGKEYRVRFVQINEYLVNLNRDYDEDIGSGLHGDGIYVIFHDDILPRLVVVETRLSYEQMMDHDYVKKCSIPRTGGTFLSKKHIQPNS
jgi:hypothetical protein